MSPCVLVSELSKVFHHLNSFTLKLNSGASFKAHLGIFGEECINLRSGENHVGLRSVFVSLGMK